MGLLRWADHGVGGCLGAGRDGEAFALNVIFSGFVPLGGWFALGSCGFHGVCGLAAAVVAPVLSG